MADPLSITASVVGVVSFGLRLATALQTYSEIASEADDALHDIIFDINGTASALRQLSELIESDKLVASEQGRRPIFKDAGEAEIRGIALKLEKVYKTIVVLVQKATSTKPATASLGSNVVIDPSAIKPFTSFSKAKWPWLAPRVDRCQTQLRWLKISLLINLQIADLAQVHLQTGPRAPGTFDQEVALRSAAETLRHRQLSLARKMAARQEKEKNCKAGPGSVASTEKTSPEASPVVKSSKLAPPPLPSAKHSAGVPPAIPVSIHTPASANTRVLSSDYTVVVNATRTLPDGGAPTLSARFPLASAEAVSEKQYENPRSQLPQESQGSQRVDGEANSPEQAQELHPPDHPAAGEPVAEAASPPAVQQRASSRLLPSFLRDWAPSIFGSPSKFLSDTPSDELEAYMTEQGAADVPAKIPFGHQRLAFGLKRTLKAKHGSTWQQYVQMTPTQRQLVDQVTKFARVQSGHVRTCLGVQEIKTEGKQPCYLIFFSLSEPPLPIYFTDCLGRNFKVPFEHCKAWDDMRSLIEQSFTYVPTLSADVRTGNYDLFAPNREYYYMPSSWTTVLRPGDKIRMEMRPPLHPKPFAHPAPRPPGAPPPNGWVGGWAGTGPRLKDVQPGGAPGRLFSRRGPSAYDFDSSDGSKPVVMMKFPVASENENEIREDEEDDLCVVDFVAESKKGEEDGVADLLRRFTHIEDVTSETIGEVGRIAREDRMESDDEGDSSDSSA
ncbi:hypothetical protein B0T14DRAFT_495159 [Immersiella caudata]|uniref:Ubiquitin-like domain-containing protein n=1 Tax=Immersiella caudata TaxID=314043 RepID=A0AA39WYL1_9PEZI|nr:hypothetical protein B0T14DRAFT_495159 [Immersiella caudata]